MNIGSNIAYLRKQKKLTQEELAEKVGVSAQSVSKWENCVNMPDIIILPKIAAELGVTVNELYAENVTDGEEKRMPYSSVPSAILSTMLGIHMNAFHHGGMKPDDVLADMKKRLDKSEKAVYECFSREGGAVRITNSVSYADMTFGKSEAGEVLRSDRAGDLLALLGENNIRIMLKIISDIILERDDSDVCMTEEELIEHSGLDREAVLSAMKKLEQIGLTEAYERIENEKYVREFCPQYGLPQLSEIMVIYRLAYLFVNNKMIERTNRWTYRRTDVNTGDC